MIPTQEPSRPGAVETTIAQRKRAVTRQALAAAALRLAMEDGLEQVTVPRIAAAAGVSARTFNNYFSSKEEAVVAPAFDRAVRIVQAFERRPASESLWEAISAAILAQFPYQAGADPLPSPSVHAALSNPALRGEQLKACADIEEMLAAAIASRLGAVSNDITPRLIAGSAIAASRIAFDHWGNTDAAVPLHAVIAHALTTVGGDFTIVTLKEKY
jgi:AcrR family transcriptional regulator